MIAHKKIWLFPVLWCCWLSLLAQPSVLSTGDWYKLSVEKAGVYRISYDLLKKMGIDPGKINPQNLQIFGREGGMLPQPNDVPRPSDLLECAIQVTGEADGRFDPGDQILFYAEGPDRYDYDASLEIFRYENNLYSDENFYFLTVGSRAGKRISDAPNLPGSHPVITTFNDFAYHEKDEYNAERSGREWFGEKFGLIDTHTVTFNLPGISAGSSVRIVSDVMGQSYSEAAFKLFLNDVPVGEQKISPIPSGRYSIKGLHKRDTLTLAAGDVSVSARASQEVKYAFLKGSGFSEGYLDFLLIDVIRDLALYENQTVFLSAASISNPLSTFQIAHAGADVHVWEITDHYNARKQEFTSAGTTTTFSAATDTLRKWIVFNHLMPEPAFVKRSDNQDLAGLATPNLLIITHPDFRAEAERLAVHRMSHSQWTVAVVTTEEIYNELSGGRQDVTALRDLAKNLYDKHPSSLKAILLFGKSSYDYKDRIINNTNFVPTYQSRNSLHPLLTYASDDYFTFLEDSEGSWEESPAQPHTLDVGVGRLPVTSLEEARTVVDKIIAYDTDQATLGSWRKKIVFVADDGNSEDNFTSLHQYQADQLAATVEDSHPAMDTRRIFMGSYKKVVQPNGEVVPDMADDIKRSFDLGALIINFTGHGSELVWADERVLTDKSIRELSNDRYPFLVTATCEFGRQDDPLQISSAEQSVTKKGGGSIGLVTTSRPVNATTNFNLNEAFYEALFERTEGGYSSTGEVFRKTKNNSASGVANRNFSLIGDPSMVLALPEYSIELTSVKTASGSDTLKALSTVTAKGEVLGPGGERATDFNGIVEATLFDKEREFVTVGKNDPPFRYTQWDNAVFRGQATVSAGEFEFTFVMPKNISYQIGSGKLSLYAFEKETGTDAKGVNTDLRIGGSETNVVGDGTAPEIELFVGDTSFVNGGITSPDTDLIVRLYDDNGINLSGYGIGNSIIATLDNDDAAYVLNDYYISDRDTHQRGSIRFPLLGLSPGPHTVTVKAWDVHNNPSTASLSFLVTDGQEIVIEAFGNYPNPFDESSTFFFTHNRSGDDLRAQLFIVNLAGKLIKSAEIPIANSGYHINLIEFNAFEESGEKLPPGLYLARLIVRSMSNGSKNEKVTKLIILN